MYLNKWLGIYKNASESKIGFMVKWDSVESNTSLTPDKWHHIAVTLSEKTASIYLDGKLEVEKQIDSELYYPKSNFRIGANVETTNQF